MSGKSGLIFLVLAGESWHHFSVADGDASIEHLARVFLAGFQIPANSPPKCVWHEVEAEFRRLAATLSDDEAKAFEKNVRRLIKDRIRP